MEQTLGRLLETAQSQVERWVGNFLEWSTTHSTDIIPIGSVVFLLAGLFVLSSILYHAGYGLGNLWRAVSRTLYYRFKGKRMGRRARRRLHRNMLAKDLEDALDRYVSNGVMKWQEANWWCERFAHAHGMWDLQSKRYCPPPPNTKLLVAEIKFRLRTGIAGPVRSIPGPKPPKPVTKKGEASNTPSSIIEAIFAKHNPASARSM